MEVKNKITAEQFLNKFKTEHFRKLDERVYDILTNIYNDISTQNVRKLDINHTYSTDGLIEPDVYWITHHICSDIKNSGYNITCNTEGNLLKINIKL